MSSNNTIALSTSYRLDALCAHLGADIRLESHLKGRLIGIQFEDGDLGGVILTLGDGRRFYARLR